EEIGADWLVYQDLDDLIECSREGNPDVDGFESSVFDGKYLAGNIDEHYLQAVEAARADEVKVRTRSIGVSDGAVVGLHNDG
ncbi:MAG: amidophosphoribosyltransferase, partial [Luminiphilus sp.]